MRPQLVVFVARQAHALDAKAPLARAEHEALLDLQASLIELVNRYRQRVVEAAAIIALDGERANRGRIWDRDRAERISHSRPPAD